MSDHYEWLVESECDTLCHIEDWLRSNEMTYRITTTDGFILGNRASRLGANALAEHQFTQLGEPIAIKRRNDDGEYIQIAQIDFCACLPDGQKCSFHNVKVSE